MAAVGLGGPCGAKLKGPGSCLLPYKHCSQPGPACSPLTPSLILFVSQKQFPTAGNCILTQSTCSFIINIWRASYDSGYSSKRQGNAVTLDLKMAPGHCIWATCWEEGTSPGPRAVRIPGSLSFYETLAVFCFSVLLFPPSTACLVLGHSLTKVS